MYFEVFKPVCVGRCPPGSEMDVILTTAAQDTIGLKTDVCDVNNIKKARMFCMSLLWSFQNS